VTRKRPKGEPVAPAPVGETRSVWAYPGESHAEACYTKIFRVFDFEFSLCAKRSLLYCNSDNNTRAKNRSKKGKSRSEDSCGFPGGGAEAVLPRVRKSSDINCK
jgi:hypothetical protein